MNPKTIEVSLDALSRLVAEGCAFHTLSAEATPLCRKKINASCRVLLYERDNCPPDCPHMAETVSWRCDGAKCPYVKKTIRRLKES